MYKNIIKKIYKNVKNEEKTDKNPRIKDYVKAVIKYEDTNFFENNDEKTIDTKIEQIRRSVAHALTVLEAEGILGKIGNSYVPIDKALKHQGRLYLLNKLHPAKKHVIKVSKKVYAIPMEPPKVLKHISNSSSESTSIDDKSYDNNSEIDKLQFEINMLKKQVEALTTRRNNIEEFFENVKNFIGAENCGSVFNIKNNLIILLDTDDKEEHERIQKELNELIKDIEKAKPKISLTKSTSK